MHLSAHLPRVRGEKVCPLCGEPEPDVFHYVALCPVAEAPRRELASTVANFLLGLGVASDYDMDYLQHVLEWFTAQVSGDLADSSIFVEPHGLSGNVGLRVLLGESRSEKFKVGEVHSGIKVGEVHTPTQSQTNAVGRFCASPP